MRARSARHLATVHLEAEVLAATRATRRAPTLALPPEEFNWRDYAACCSTSPRRSSTR